jgi:hypothetical protein
LDADAVFARGDDAVLEIGGAYVGETIYLLASRAGVGAGPCDPLLGGQCLGIRGPVRLLTTIGAYPGGSTTLTMPVPDTLPIGIEVGLQAVVVRGYSGADSLLSPSVTVEIGPGPQDTGGAGCPAEMAELPGDVCIDRWEAHLVGQSPYDVPTAGVAASAPGTVPQAYISGDVAGAACAAAGKRLCSRAEWELACTGGSRTYPYGNSYDAAACNTERSSHPVLDLFGGATNWSGSQLNDPRLNQLPDSLDLTGSNPSCVTPEGVYDLHGNVHEWIADPAGTFKGGFYVDAVINGAGCSYTTTAHGTSYHDYSTGFRCCADL